ncbi:MAG TPA: GNAT family N-acetyltransferase [Candidatus Limnocylindria bacterium]|jgi:RimJ/RimL family protein N-acetyltransferase|nr:GNAT family N-acetyltransferase [Candidatus Limnocylindria bacterium]
MPLVLLDAFVDGNAPRARELVDYSVPADFPGTASEVLELRRVQLTADPGRLPWSVRAIVRRDDRVMIGFVNFHGPPGTNDIEAADAAELGWTVFPEHRGQGYATETARRLMDWARDEHGVRRFISSTTPENAPSLRVHEKLGFHRTGQVVDGEIIFELAP